MKPPELFLNFLSALCLLSNASFFLPDLTVKKKRLKMYFFPFLITVRCIKSCTEASLCMLVCASPQRGDAEPWVPSPPCQPIFLLCNVLQRQTQHEVCSPSRNEALNQSVEVGVNKDPAVQGAP